VIAWLIHSALPASVTGAAAALPLWARMVAAMIVGEIGFYWGHRWSHEIAFLWRFHAVHHSAEHVNFWSTPAATRRRHLHPTVRADAALCRRTRFAGRSEPVAGANAGVAHRLALELLHPRQRSLAAGAVGGDHRPAFHHWHHTLEDHKDHNYSSMLPFIDRLFGTFYLPKAWPKDYGTSTPVPETMIGQLLEPLAPSGAARVPSPAQASSRA
jgi:Fatty acid hydroxylase superfamily